MPSDTRRVVGVACKTRRARPGCAVGRPEAQGPIYRNVIAVVARWNRVCARAFSATMDQIVPDLVEQPRMLTVS